MLARRWATCGRAAGGRATPHWSQHYGQRRGLVGARARAGGGRQQRLRPSTVARARAAGVTGGRGRARRAEAPQRGSMPGARTRARAAHAEAPRAGAVGARGRSRAGRRLRAGDTTARGAARAPSRSAGAPEESGVLGGRSMQLPAFEASIAARPSSRRRRHHVEVQRVLGDAAGHGQRGGVRPLLLCVLAPRARSRTRERARSHEPSLPRAHAAAASRARAAACAPRPLQRLRAARRARPGAPAPFMPARHHLTASARSHTQVRRTQRTSWRRATAARCAACPCPTTRSKWCPWSRRRLS
jgi:hypothetical protein